MMLKLDVAAKRGTVLNGVLFRQDKNRTADTVMIAITGIHGNFYSNPFYYNIGNTLKGAGIDFIYAQTNDAFGEIETFNVHTGKRELIGSWNERFAYTDEDIDAYLTYAQQAGYRHIILAGHSLGANKVIYYLSRHRDSRVERFFLLSPANLSHMMSGVTEREKQFIREMVESGRGNELLPFPFMGWVECIAFTAWDWAFSGMLNNVWTEPGGDFSQCQAIRHSGALLIGTYDNFAGGDPAGFLRNINAHMPTARENKLIFIEKTGHTYQMKHQEVADKILKQLQDWRENDAVRHRAG